MHTGGGGKSPRSPRQEGKPQAGKDTDKTKEDKQPGKDSSQVKGKEMGKSKSDKQPGKDLSQGKGQAVKGAQPKSEDGVEKVQGKPDGSGGDGTQLSKAELKKQRREIQVRRYFLPIHMRSTVLNLVQIYFVRAVYNVLQFLYQNQKKTLNHITISFLCRHDLKI